MIEPQVMEHMPAVAPGETIVPGSFELQTEENLMSPSDEAPSVLPAPDASAKIDVNEMIESSIKAESIDPSLMVRATEPLVWEVQPFGISSAGKVSPVSICTAVNSH